MTGILRAVRHVSILIAVLVVSALFSAMSLPESAAAVPATQENCENSGGRWVNVGVTAGVPQYSCTCPSGDLYIDGACIDEDRYDCERGGGDWESGICSNDDDENPAAGGCEPRRSVLGFPTWYRGLDFDGDCSPVVSVNDLRSTSSSANPILIIILNITDMIARLAGIIAVAFVIVGGFKYVLSDGAPDKAADARKTIINALVGAVIAGAAAVIVTTIVGGLT